MMVAKDDTERVDRWVDALPTRRFLSDESLRSLKGPQIKIMLEDLQVSKEILSYREKEELLSALLIRRSSSCAVCMQDFKEKDAYRQTICGHGFHDECLRAWAIKTPRCPTCCVAIKPPKRALPTADLDNSADEMFKDISLTSLKQLFEPPRKKSNNNDGCTQQ
jgi:hypothetical protein